ncbi:phospholipid methyltransferase [Pelomyxa schiedti]|nr:phospholipid methyltransferase [Pelomyxa schiedti]
MWLAGLLFGESGTFGWGAQVTALCCLHIVANPTLWNTIGHAEYKRRFVSKFFGGKRKVACLAFAAFVFGIGITRDMLYSYVVSVNPKVEVIPHSTAVFVARLLFLIGTTLVFFSFYQLGLYGTYLGDHFGMLLPAKITAFPFNVMSSPMYNGSTINFLATAIYYQSPVGLVLTAFVFIVYKIAIIYEDDFTNMIYSNAASKKKKKARHASPHADPTVAPRRPPAAAEAVPQRAVKSTNEGVPVPVPVPAPAPARARARAPVQRAQAQAEAKAEVGAKALRGTRAAAAVRGVCWLVPKWPRRWIPLPKSGPGRRLLPSQRRPQAAAPQPRRRRRRRVERPLWLRTRPGPEKGEPSTPAAEAGAGAGAGVEVAAVAVGAARARAGAEAAAAEGATVGEEGEERGSGKPRSTKAAGGIAPSSASPAPIIPDIPPTEEELKTVGGVFRNTAITHKKEVALRHKNSAGWTDINWDQYLTTAIRVAKSFHAMSGSRSGSTGPMSINICCLNCLQWYYVNAGAILANVIPVSVPFRFLAGSCISVATQTSASIVFVDTDEQYEKYAALTKVLPTATIVRLGDADVDRKRNTINWDTFLSIGEKVATETVLHHKKPVLPSSPCAAIAIDTTAASSVAIHSATETASKASTTTSGIKNSLIEPKCLMYSHQNVLTAAHLCCSNVTLQSTEKGICFLPLSSIAEQVGSFYTHILLGHSVALAPVDASMTISTLIETLVAVKPTIFVSVLHIWNKLAKCMKQIIEGKSRAAQSLYGWAAKKELLFLQEHQQPLPPCFAHNKFSVPLQQALGLDSIRYCAMYGSLPCRANETEHPGEKIANTFHSIGVHVNYCFGVPETTGLLFASKPDIFHPNSVGVVMDSDITVEISNGELLCQSPTVFMGYWGNPTLTNQVKLSPSKTRTGYIAERIAPKSELFQITGTTFGVAETTGCEIVDPLPIEQAILLKSPQTKHALVAGHARNYLCGVLFCSNADDSERTHFEETLRSAVEAVNETLPESWKVKRICVITKRAASFPQTVKPENRVLLEKKYHMALEKLYTKPPIESKA